MLKIGENSGRLVNILAIASNYYEDQLNYKIKTFSTFIEPMMILILAGIVCIILLAVFLPMLSIFDSINGGVM